MNAVAFRQLYDYHFVENRKIWDAIMSLSQEQFMRPVGYSVGSIRNHIVHMMSADNYWFSGLRGLDMPDMLDPNPFEDRAGIRADWNAVEQTMRDYLASLRDETLLEHPFTEGEDQKLIVWQILLHVANHGTDHRAQLLRLLSDVGLQTGPQDYIFYIFDRL